jgi:hypothetical protein
LSRWRRWRRRSLSVAALDAIRAAKIKRSVSLCMRSKASALPLFPAGGETYWRIRSTGPQDSFSVVAGVGQPSRPKRTRGVPGVIGAGSGASLATGYAQWLAAHRYRRPPLHSVLALESPWRRAGRLLLLALSHLEADQSSSVSSCRDLSYRARSAAIADRLRLAVAG